jgi:hypothetical protein
MDSDMQGGPVDELLDVAVERPVLDRFYPIHPIKEAP